jgi:uncharacterized membrane protein YdjX (TVP38/TMEM64 family)
MRRYLFIVGGILLFFLSLFFLVEALGVPLLTDPSPWLARPGALAAALGVGLLIADVLLPVPSSLVMVAHGALFGVAVGTLLSLAGSLGAALFGFAIGRRGGPLLERLVTPAEKARVDALLSRYGALAIVITRPVPLLAETTAILAGASPLGWWRLSLATLAGSLPPSLLYALTGAFAGSFQSVTLMFVLVMLATGCFWLVGRWLEPRLTRIEGRPAKISPHAD